MTLSQNYYIMEVDGYFFYKKGRTAPETPSLVLGSLTLYLYYTMYCKECQHIF
ncbi:hypothetical protein [Staphylococcus phage vB_ScaM-V1SC01]|nr:hypothetical protein [Staphylococcus phage vB_ScaM-V1SC01]WPF67607.1 hypothetical protein [Staphylococcus phage vB_SauM-V1SA12]